MTLEANFCISGSGLIHFLLVIYHIACLLQLLQNRCRVR